MTRVTMNYYVGMPEQDTGFFKQGSLNQSDLERITEISNGLNEGVQAVARDYKTVKVSIGIKGTGMLDPHSTYFVVGIEDRQDKYSVLAATQLIISAAGEPYSVTGGYEIADECLRSRGKTLEKKTIMHELGLHLERRVVQLDRW